MMWFKKIVTKFVEWSKSEYKCVFVKDLPKKVGNKIFYIVGEKEQPWLIAFNCPCGCSNLIQLNLLKEAYPCWKYKVTKKSKLNISPSVWRISGCKSHFTVHKSKIDWIRYNETGKSFIPRFFSQLGL